METFGAGAPGTGWLSTLVAVRCAAVGKRGFSTEPVLAEESGGLLALGVTDLGEASGLDTARSAESVGRGALAVDEAEVEACVDDGRASPPVPRTGNLGYVGAGCFVAGVFKYPV